MSNKNTAKFRLDENFRQIITHNLSDTAIVVALIGEPAIGKTSFIKSLGQEADAEVFVLDVNTLADRGDLIGVRNTTITDEQGNTHHVQETVPHKTIAEANSFAAANPDKKVYLLLDEINRNEPDVTSATLTMPTARRLGNLNLEPNIHIIVSGNTEGNVTPLDSASLTRFAVYHVLPSAETFLSIHKGNLHPVIEKVLTEHPHLILDKPGDSTVNTDNDPDEDNDDMALIEASFDENSMELYAAPRTITGLNSWLNSADTDANKSMLQSMIVDNIDNTDPHSPSVLQATIAAHTGDTEFTDRVVAGLIERINGPATPTGTRMAGTPQKPMCWDQFTRNGISRGEQEALVTKTSPKNLIGTLAYALTQSLTPAIANLIPAIDNELINKSTNLPKDTIRELSTAALNDLINTDTFTELSRHAQNNNNPHAASSVINSALQSLV